MLCSEDIWLRGGPQCTQLHELCSLRVPRNFLASIEKIPAPATFLCISQMKCSLGRTYRARGSILKLISPGHSLRHRGKYASNLGSKPRSMSCLTVLRLSASRKGVPFRIPPSNDRRQMTTYEPTNRHNSVR